MSRAVIFFAQGLEECEGLIVVDILRRAGVTVDIAAVGGSQDIVSSHDVHIHSDILAEDAKISSYDAVVLPGGLPGSDYLRDSELVRNFVCEMDAAEKLICAVCAAPGVLAQFGVLQGCKATVFPGREHLLEENGASYTAESVTVDGRHITGEGMGATIPFALEILAALEGREVADDIKERIRYRF